jgi:CRISPR/Cas system CSM-associated protein Csm3 (group 7 of RAMP superfamily)
MKTGIITKKQGQQDTWIFKSPPKYNPNSFILTDIPDDWDGKEVQVTHNEKGKICTVTCGEMTIGNVQPVYQSKQSTEPKTSAIALIKNEQRKEERKYSDFNKSKKSPQTQQSYQKNQKDLKPSNTPYNFVPLNDVVVSAPEPYNDRSSFTGLSGYIDFDIETLTHLFIKGKEYDFFKIGGKNAIPGSSLRGMIRSLVEMVSYGKFERFNDTIINYRVKGQVKDRNFGFLFYDSNVDNYVIYLGYKPGTIDPSNKFEYRLLDSGEIEIHTEGIGNTHRSFKVQYAKSNNIPIPIEESAIKAYKDDTQRNAGKPMNDVLGLAKNENNLLINKCKALNIPTIQYIGIPVFFKLNDNKKVESFGHCRNYRIPYTNSVGDAGPIALNEKQVVIDIASSIFGFSKKEKDENGKEQTEMYAGKVFFEDVTTESKVTQDAILQILAAPKPKSGKLYLEPTSNGDTGTWGNNPTIRGYKLYHHRNTDIQKIEDDKVGEGREQINWQKTRFRERDEYNKFGRINDTTWQTGRLGYGKRNQDGTYKTFHVFTKKISALSDDQAKINIYNACKSETNPLQFKTVKALPPNTTFKGARIRFEHLTDVELGALLFAVNLPPDCRHKIGMGKPLGLGSIHVNNIKLIVVDRRVRYQSLFDKNNIWNTEESIVEPDTYTKAFRDHINNTINHKGDLWQHSRMQELYAMLRYDENVIKNETYLIDTNYMHLDEFKDRGNLPKASDVQEKYFKSK